MSARIFWRRARSGVLFLRTNGQNMGAVFPRVEGSGFGWQAGPRRDSIEHGTERGAQDALLGHLGLVEQPPV